MEVMTGYKQTEVGVIPMDWQVVNLGDVSVISRLAGAEYTSLWSETPTGEIIALRGFNIGQGKIVDRDFARISNSLSMKLKRSRLCKGDVVYPCVGSIGNAAVIDEDNKYHIQQNIARITPNPKLISSPYLASYLMSFLGLREVERFNSSSSQPSVLVGNLRQYRIALPSTEAEQEVIAQKLTDIDALIAGLEKLIAKKRNLRQAAMQQLLTGQTRLPGFSGDWLRTELKHLVCTPITDGPHLTPTFYETGVPFLSVNNLTNNRIDLTDLRFISKADDEIFSRKCKPRKGDVLLGKAASVGKVAIVEDDLDFNIWSPIALARSGETLDAKFLYYQLLSADSITQVTLLTNSSSQGNIGMGDIEKIQISYPCVGEQIAISKVLTSMDMEISALESRRSKTAALKQGMMQELLTGRTRLV